MNLKQTVNPLSRRQMLAGSAASLTLAGFAVSGFSFADGMSKGMDHAQHAMHQHNSSNPLLQAVIDKSMECVKYGRACAQHCVEMFQSGDQSMKDCYAAVQELIVSCDALSQFARQHSAHMREFMQVCTSVCESCEKVCRKYEKDYKQCHDCAESCKACLKACKDYLA